MKNSQKGVISTAVSVILFLQVALVAVMAAGVVSYFNVNNNGSSIKANAAVTPGFNEPLLARSKPPRNDQIVVAQASSLGDISNSRAHQATAQ
jgi:hypothetical protein